MNVVRRAALLSDNVCEVLSCPVLAVSVLPQISVRLQSSLASVNLFVSD